MRKLPVFAHGLAAFKSQVFTTTNLSDSLEDKQQFWHQHLNYDPYGLFGATRHEGQVQLHDAMADPAIKVIVIRAGKRGGKSTGAHGEGIYKLYQRKHVWTASANYDLTKPIFDPIWQHVVGGSRLGVTFKDRRKMRLEVEGGGFIAGKTWENQDQLEAEAVDLVIADEAQKLDGESFRLLYARTVDSQGKLLLLGSEQENSMDFDDLCEQAEIRDNWAFITWKTTHNPAFQTPEGQAELAEARQIMSAEQYEALFEAKKRPNHESVFWEFDRNLHARDLAFYEDEPVELWIDPGGNYYAVLAVQFHWDRLGWEEAHVIDEVYLSPATNDTAIAEAKTRPWFTNVRSIVIDIAGLQKNANSDISAITAWQLATTTLESPGGIYPRYQQVGIQKGIERTHTALKDPASQRPRLLFDKNRCPGAIAEFRGLYKYRKNRDGGRSSSDLPLDKMNHAAKAVAYGLIDHWGDLGFESGGWQQPAPTRASGGYRGQTNAQRMSRFYDGF